MPHPSEYRVALQRAGYTPLPRFAILDEHVHVRDDGKGTENFTPARLQKLADKLNRRVLDTGDPPAICVGHTGRMNKNQPSVGTPMDFTVEPLYGTGKQAIWCTPFARKGEEETFRKYNRRSVELWTGGPDGDDIDPIALLGADAPRRNLGLHLFSRDGGERCYHYSREVEGDDEMPDTDRTGAANGTRVGDMTVEALAGALAPALAKTQEFAPLFEVSDQLQGLMQQEEQFMGGLGGQPQPGMGVPGGAGMPGMGQPPMAGAYPQQFSRQPVGHYGPDVYGTWQPNPGQPGYGTYVPPPAPPQYRGTPTRAGSGNEPQQPAQFQKLVEDAVAKAMGPMQEALKLQKERNDELEIDNQLRQLAAERVKFDFQKERDELKAMLPEHRAKHFERMRANYARLDQWAQPDPAALGTGPGGFPVPAHAQAPTDAPHPAAGHALTVGAMMPGDENRGGVFLGRGGVPIQLDRANDEHLFRGMDPFQVAAAAQAQKQDVGTFLAQFQRAQAGGQPANGQAQPSANGAVEKVR